MELSFMAIAAAIMMVLMAGSTSASLVSLHAPVDGLAFSLSSVLHPSTSSPFSYSSNSLVTIYISDKLNNSAYQTMCPAPAAAFNATRKTLITLKTRAGCTVSLHVGVYVLDRWSEAKRKDKDARIVSRIRGNRADFQAFKHRISSDAQSSVVTLSLRRMNTDELINSCSVVDLVLLVQHLLFDETTQPFIFSWTDTIMILLLTSILAHINYSTWYFIQLRPRLHDYFDPFELERQWLEDRAEDGDFGFYYLFN